MNTSYDEQEKSAVVTDGDRPFSVSFLLKTQDYTGKPVSVVVRDDCIEAVFPGCSVSCGLRSVDRSCIELAYTWRFTSRCKAAVACVLGFPEQEPRQIFIPAVLFNGNDRGHGAFPTGGLEQIHSFREDRMPLPGCQLFFDHSEVICTFLDPPVISAPAGVSSYTRKAVTCSRLEYPAVERPFSYQGKTARVKPESSDELFDTGVCSSDMPFVLKRRQYVCVIRNEPENRFDAAFSAYTRILSRIIPLTGRFPLTDTRNAAVPWDTWFLTKLAHLRFLVETVPSETGTDTAYVKMGKGNGTIQSVYEFTGASFLVKSLEAAVLFSETGNGDLGIKIGDFFLKGESSDFPGVFRDNHDLRTGVWGGYLGIAEDGGFSRMVNARCNGEAMLQYVLLYESLARKGIRKPGYIALARRVAAFYLNHQLDNGSYGRWWTPEGNPVNTVGTNGAYIIPFLLKLVPYCNPAEQSDLCRSVKKAARWYTDLIEHSGYYGDTLDADAYDKESAAILVRICLDLFEFFHDEYYLRCAEKAADFVCTWIWWYDVVFPEHTPLRNLYFQTTGMTSVSVAHHHLDFYGIYCAWDFFRLSRYLEMNGQPGTFTGGNWKFYKSAARRMLNACNQLVADSRNSFLGKTSDFSGWQPEQINYTAWDYFDRSDHQKGFYDVCVAWVPVLTLGAFLKIRNDFPEEVK